MYDLIGDIHGHADELEALLKKLVYTQKNGAYVHPDQRVLFVGDYIDRGPQIPKTLDIVRRMVEAGAAIALMGNHEYNALCFHIQERAGGHVRTHSIKNILQHYQTLLQFQNRQKEYDEWLEWFMTLPLFHEEAAFRAVHACWDPKHIALPRRELPNGHLNEELVYRSAEQGTPLNIAIDETLKGKDLEMPEGRSFTDKDKNVRHHIRYKWWVDPPDTGYYTKDELPVFFGHYWLTDAPALFRSNVCCVDYSVANNGKLVAYRFDGEAVLENDRFVVV
ncbi:MAG: metallophosphoesterase [Flavobacteriales bacterium]